MEEKVPRQGATGGNSEHGESEGRSLTPPAFQVVAGGSGTTTNTGSTPPPTGGPAAPPLNPLINIDNLAQRIHTAIDGWGTDEEQVYLALQQVRGNSTAIDALKSAYQRLFNASLEADIRDDFSGTELDYALSLLNSGATAPPTTPDPNRYDAAANAIWAAVEGAGTDEEAIFAALVPFNCNLAEINRVAAAYQRLHNEDLRARLADELSGSEYTYAMQLMGGPAMVANVEVQSVSLQQARLLFTELANLTFVNDAGQDTPVPYHYPTDGCYSRAHLMAERLTALGYASEKVFAVSRKDGGSGLHVPSNRANDMPGAPTVTWWYHVAPIIRVQQTDGSVVRMVMDPSTANEPIRIEAWTGLMRQEVFEEFDLAGIQGFLSQNGGFTSDRNFVYTTPRDTVFPTGFRENDPEGANQEFEGTRARMSRYAELARAHDMAAAIRTELGNAAPSPDRIIGIFNGATGTDRTIFRQGLTAMLEGQQQRISIGFPNLIHEMRHRFSAADFTRIETAMNQP